MNMQNKKDEIFNAYNESEAKLAQVEEEKATMFEQMKKMMAQMEIMQEELSKKSEESTQVVKVAKEKVPSIKLMSLSIGQCHLVDGILSARFDKAFDIIPLREPIFQDFFYRFKRWFDDMDVIILDDEVAEEYGMKHLYDKNNITQDFMDKALEGDSETMITKVNAMIPKHRLVFIKYFAQKAVEGDERANDTNKHYALERYVADTFGFNITIKQIMEEIN